VSTAPVPRSGRPRSNGDAYPNAKLIHLPVHASRLNQIEIRLSIVHHKAATPDGSTG
jgi:hypothetical protein